MRDNERIGGQLWNPFSRNTISVSGLQPPLTSIDLFGLHEALDHITAAVESGNLRRDTWPEQLFANREVFDEFVSNLSGYDECFRIVDRWWCALADLIDTGDEEGFIHTRDMADEIQRVFDELNARRPQWTKPAKKAATKKKAVAA
jgi:hypothetical protein